MMLIVALLALAATVRAAAVPSRFEPAAGSQFEMANVAVTPLARANVGSAAMCGICVKFFTDSLDILLNVIVNSGVVGSCAELCGYLPKQLEAEVCSLLCDVVGIMGFIRVLEDVDPDPIALCQNIDGTCPTDANAKANITALNVLPPSAAKGATFDIKMIFQIFSIGTGTLNLDILPPKGDGQAMPLGQLLVETPPGIYELNGQLKTDQMSMQEPFRPGTFHVIGQLCEGECGAKYADSKLLSQRISQFEISAKK